MRDLSYFVATSLDGFIAGPDGDIDWLFTGGDYGYSEFYRSVDCVAMGRKTFELSLSFPEYPYRGKRAYVFTRRTLKPPHPDVVIVHEPPDAFLAELKQKAPDSESLSGERSGGSELRLAGRTSSSEPPLAGRTSSNEPPLAGRTGNKIWFVGGGELGGALIQAGLIDELVLTIHPVTLGRGIPLFNPHDRRTDWALQTVTSYREGLVQVTYRRARE